jgi:Spy/CpxP family protein refolding chaperone
MRCAPNDRSHRCHDINGRPQHQLIRNPCVLPTNCDSTHRPQQKVELGLTDQQKQQIVPILQEEIMQLAALKKNASLSGAHKVEQLRKLGVSFDEKIMPLLNAEQQPKFQTLREQARREMIETMGSAAVRKLEGELEKKL